jgi:hypothetical protein
MIAVRQASEPVEAAGVAIAWAARRLVVTLKRAALGRAFLWQPRRDGRTPSGSGGQRGCE